MLALCLPFLLALTGAQSSPVAVATSPCPRLLAGTARWSDPATWPGGALPSTGDCVVIPAGKTVWLDVTPPPLGGLSIDGALIFACKDLELRADRIAVTGKLEIGNEQHPFHRHATLTLTDDFTCSPEHQALSVEDGGVLRLIGEARPWSWMQLDQHAAPGSSQLVLERPSGWRAGDRVVVASSDFDAHQAEARTVTVASGTVLLLDQPLTYQHFGEHVGKNVDGVGVDERTEVGLLTRPIVVRGTPTADAQGRVHGGWVAARRTTATPRVEIAWTAFQDLGVEGLADRHPLHFDGLGDALGSYVRSASFERSLNRALAVSATDHVAIEDCVAFDTLGHAFWIEDDSVRGTSWRNNLCVLTRAARPGFATSPSDLAPAAFWLRHPDVVCEDNVAAGCDAYGFQIEVADGETTPQKWFARNVAHSCGEIGFFQDRRPHPASPSIWSDLVAWKNRRYGVWWRSYGSVVLANLRAADNRCAVYLASEGIQNDFIQLSGIADLRMIGGLVVGESKNVGTPKTALELAVGRSLAQLAPNAPVHHLPAWDVLTGVEVYDSLLTVDGTTFANFYDLSLAGWIDRKAGAFSQVQHNSPWAIDPRNHVANLSFSKARRVWFRTPLGAYAINPVLGDDGIANAVLVDDDGSLSGLAGSVVFPPQPLLVPSASATFSPDWNAWVTAGAPTAPFAQLELANWMPQAVGQAGTPKLSVRRVSTGGVQTLVQPIYGAAQTHTDRYTTNVTTGESYAFEYDPATPVTEWSSVFSLSLQYTEPGRSVVVAVPLPPIQTGSVEIDGAAAYAAASLVELTSAPSGFFYDATTGVLHLKLTTGGAGSTVFDGLRSTATVVAF